MMCTSSEVNVIFSIGRLANGDAGQGEMQDGQG
jgi:hypothetical protein